MHKPSRFQTGTESFFASTNELEGLIPTEFGNLPVLEFLDLSSNLFGPDCTDELFQIPSIGTLQQDDKTVQTWSIVCPPFLTGTTISCLSCTDHIPSSLCVFLFLHLDESCFCTASLDLASNSFNGTQLPSTWDAEGLRKFCPGATRWNV